MKKKTTAVQKYLYWLYGPNCYPRDNDERYRQQAIGLL